MIALLATLWQGDSAFPSGGFAFSNGLEGAAALDAPLDRGKLEVLLATTLRHRWATADRLAVIRAFRAADLVQIGVLDRALEAATLSEPLRTGSRRNGAAFLLSHGRLGTEGAVAFRSAIAAGAALGHLPVAQGWIWRRCGLDEASAVAASGYTVAAGLVNAAVRLGSVGAIDAQGALLASLRVIAECATDDLDDLSVPPTFSSMTPWLDVAAIRQARSNLRLFSN